jgi:fatty acid desaturase
MALSNLGVGCMLALLYAASQKFTFPLVFAAYMGPYSVVNAWLVAYTWLQHTEVDIPHLPAEGYNFMKGAFHTVDRPYEALAGGVVNFLHHDIGTTHVLHHIDSTIPHYNARRGTEAIKEAFPEQYLYESTPIFKAIWRLATKCFVVEKRQNRNLEDMYVFVD